MILPSPDVAETLRKSHGVSRVVGAVVGTLDLLEPFTAPDHLWWAHWWAHRGCSRINIELTILPEKTKT